MAGGQEGRRGANKLIKMGFDAPFVFSLTKLFVTGDGMIWMWGGDYVPACIGVSHASLINGLADFFGVDPQVGRSVVRAGFAMQAQIEALRATLLDPAENIN